MDKLNFIFRYIKYKIFARHKYGYGIHSPFVYNLITGVFNDNFNYQAYNEVEQIRKTMNGSEKAISFADQGAGSHRFKTGNRNIRDIARYSSVNKKSGRLLFRLVRYFKPDTMIELGTSLGISTMYMAKGYEKAKVISIEANSALAGIAGQNFQAAGIHNVEVINDSFENALPGIIRNLEKNVLVFIDGNHEKEATLKYYSQFMEKAKNNHIIIFDDINWSESMNEAWNRIKSDPASGITVDLFFMGIVYPNKSVQKQNFVIRF